MTITELDLPAVPARGPGRPSLLSAFSGDIGGLGGPGPPATAGRAVGTSVPYDPAHSQLAGRWPALACRPVRIGGLTVTFADAAAAAALLASSRTSAIAPVLHSAGSPLESCDYFGAAAPYLDTARQVPKTGRCGAAGRHVTKHAFLLAVFAELDAAREQEMALWRSALATDERYAAAIAADAVALRQRAQAAGIRSSVRSAVVRATAACAAEQGLFTCTEPAACGTGGCRFAQAAYAEISAAAGPGRIARPRNHADAGAGFSEAPAAEELAAALPWRAGVPVQDCAPRRAA